MNLDDLNDLPAWDDDYIKRLHGEEEEGDAWKPNPTRDACKAMYIKWNEIITMLKGALAEAEEDAEEPGQHGADFISHTKNLILSDAFEVGAKIRSSEAGRMYILRMENAAIIRKNAQYIKTAMLGMDDEMGIDTDHCDIIRDEIDNFRVLFKTWVATFEKDEFEDEWGLFTQ